MRVSNVCLPCQIASPSPSPPHVCCHRSPHPLEHALHSTEESVRAQRHTAGPSALDCVPAGCKAAEKKKATTGAGQATGLGKHVGLDRGEQEAVRIKPHDVVVFG